MADDASAVNTTEVADTSTTDSAPVENPTTEAESTDEMSDIMQEELNQVTSDDDKSNDGESEDETQQDGSEETHDDQDEDTNEHQSEQEPQFTKAEKRKEQLNQEIRQMVEYKRQLEQELSQFQNQSQQYDDQSQQYDQPFTEDQLLDTVNPDTGEYFTPAEARTVLLEQQVQQMQQSLQQREYQAQVERSQADLARDIESSLKEYPLFDARSDQYNAGIADRARNFIQANLVTDANGQIVGSRMPIREILSTFVDIQSSSTAQGEAKARQATNKMMTNADTGTSILNQDTRSEQEKFVNNFFND